MFDFTAYLFLADQQFVIFLHRWFDVSQWYYIYPLAMLHTSAWVVLKIGVVRVATVIVQKRIQHHRAVGTPRIRRDTGWRRWLRKLRSGMSHLAHEVYAGAKKVAHGKSVSGYSLFWIALTPLIQKIGDAIVGIRWQQFGWRGVGALCLGASVQAGCLCLLYSIYGRHRAEQLMLWIMIPLGIAMLLMWLLKNGRAKSA